MNTETLVSQIAIALIVFGALFYRFCKPGKGVTKELPRIVFFTAVFIAGFILNWVGSSRIYSEGNNPGEVINIGSAVITTLQMFVLNTGMERIESLSVDNLFYGIAYILCYVAAVICTVLFAVQLFFKNLWNTLSLFFLTHSTKKTWIIVGKGVCQETLLKNLTQRQKSTTILIPNENNEEEKKEYINKGYLVINGELSLEILKKAGFFNSKETTLIAISDDDAQNLETARMITEYLKNPLYNTREQLCFSAHIMYTNVERVEHFKFSEDAEGKIQFFNPYEITARHFLFDNPITKFIPEEHIDTGKALLKEKDGFDFLHVFIGFGKANREFLKQSIAANQILGIDYHALVIDKDIKDSQNSFMNQCPGIFASGGWHSDKYFPAPKEKYNIEFLECNALSKEMYDTVISYVRKADASTVIVSLGNVQLNAETAMEFRQRCYGWNIAKEKINIFIKAKEHSPIVAPDVLNPELNNNKDKLNTKPNNDKDELSVIKIEPFGFEDAILTLDHIENRDMDILAKHIAASYADKSIKIAPEEMDEIIKVKWCKIGNFKRGSNLSAALSICVKLNMMGFDLVYDKPKAQDASEEWGRVYGIEDAQKLHEANEVERDAEGKIANTIRNNLARLEHQRWNAFHLTRGWLPLAKNMVSADSHQSERAKEHACITTFEGLEELAKLQAELKCRDDPNLEYLEVLKAIDTMHYDCDQMDFLIGNLVGTKYRIVKRGSCELNP